MCGLRCPRSSAAFVDDLLATSAKAVEGVSNNSEADLGAYSRVAHTCHFDGFGGRSR